MQFIKLTTIMQIVMQLTVKPTPLFKKLRLNLNDKTKYLIKNPIQDQ